jgi:hypothetical protein
LSELPEGLHHTVFPFHVSTHRDSCAAKARINRHRVIDLAIRFTLALTFALSAGFYFKNALAKLHSVDPAHLDAKLLVFIR